MEERGTYSGKLVLKRNKCGESLHQTGNLQRQLKGFTCNECGEVFRHSQNLFRHKRTHTQGRNHFSATHVAGVLLVEEHFIVIK